YKTSNIISKETRTFLKTEAIIYHGIILRTQKQGLALISAHTLMQEAAVLIHGCRTIPTGIFKTNFHLQLYIQKRGRTNRSILRLVQTIIKTLYKILLMSTYPTWHLICKHCILLEKKI